MILKFAHEVLNYEPYIFILGLIVYFIVLCFIVTRVPRYVNARKMYLFRSLFPSWKFFEDIVYLPVLYMRTGNSSDLQDEQWVEVLPRIERNWKYLFMNPEGNLLHAYNSLIQQLEYDKEDTSLDNPDSLASSVSYLLVKNMVRKHIEGASHITHFQFKLRAIKQGSSVDAEDTLISLVHPHMEG